MQLQVRHKSLYRYTSDVTRSHHLLYLRPRATPQQKVIDAKIHIAPAPKYLVAMTDRYGNCADEIEIEEAHRTLEVTSEAHVSVEPMPHVDPKASMRWEDVRRLIERPTAELAQEVVPFLFSGRYTAPDLAITAYAKRSFPEARPILAGAIDLMHRIHRDFKYAPGATDVMTPVEHSFAMRAGVCQDLAHIGIACLRSLGFAARYVSGYLLTHPPPGEAKLLGADRSHAWFSVYAPPFGWIDLDPTNDIQPSDQHITLAWGRDYGDVAPVSGTVVGGGPHTVEVSVDVAQLATGAIPSAV